MAAIFIAAKDLHWFVFNEVLQILRCAQDDSFDSFARSKGCVFDAQAALPDTL